MPADIYQILRDHWGYEDFRELQKEIIESVLDGHDTIGLLPTGGGKSITFQVPAMALDGLTLVVTPLISLMKDQVDNLRDHGIKALYLHAGLTLREQNLAFDRCRFGKVKLLYVSPEKLQSPRFIDKLSTMDVRFLVVDEAHCISQWGYDFRPSYLNISKLRDTFNDVPVLALTASATPDVVTDIAEKLKLTNHRIFSKSFARTNISYVVRHGDHKEDMLVRILRAVDGCGIVYVRSRKRTRELVEILTKNNISADFYHAGLSIEDKNEKQQRWKEGDTRIMVATNAFGMGIDKPDVRVVVHFDMPSSLEEYYQEAGRAGRDGKPSYAVLLASQYDKSQLTRRINDSFPDKDYIKRVYELLGNFMEVAVGSGYNQIYEFNFTLFCDRFGLKPIQARSALLLLTQAGYIEYVDEIATRSRVMVLATKNELYDLRIDATADKVLQLLLRTYTGLFADYVFISEPLMAKRLGFTEQQIYESLLALGRHNVIHYVPRKSTPYVLYTTSRELPRYVQLPLSVYEERRRQMERRIEAMKAFAFKVDECRESIILKYFGEENPTKCGKCDICRDEKRGDEKRETSQSLREGILYLASQPGGHTVQYISRQLSTRVEQVIAEARLLADEGTLRIDGLTLKCDKH